MPGVTTHFTAPATSLSTSSTAQSATSIVRCLQAVTLSLSVCVYTGLELASDWAWYWYLIIAVVGDLVLATIVYISYRWWNRRHNAQTAAAFEQSKLGNATVPTAGRAPVQLTASAAAGQPASNPYYNRSFTPAPGLQQPLRSTYAYPGAAAR